MNIATRYVSRDYLRNGKLNIQGGSTSYSGSSSYGGGLTGNYLPAISNGDGTYTVDLTNVTFNGNIVATGEVTAYGSGESEGTSGSVTVYDGLDSTDASVALSANLGRVLKEMITSLDIGDIDLSGYYSKEDIDNLINGYSKTDHTHTFASLTSKPTTLSGYGITDAVPIKGTLTNNIDFNDYYTSGIYNNTTGNGSGNTNAPYTYGILTVLADKNGYASQLHISSSGKLMTRTRYMHSSEFVWSDWRSYAYADTVSTHTADTTVHITDAERTKWNGAVTNSHTHSNKTILDGITSTKVSNWDTVYSNWNEVFTIDSNGDLKVKVNVIGEKEISAYGAGTSSGSGSITIVDALTSTSTDAALSANQGRVLKELIDNIDLSNVNVDLSNYYTKTEVDTKLNGKANSSHTHTIANITNLQTTLDGKASTSHTHSNYASSSHTHNYVSTVKVGTTSYAVSSNTVTLPAYPTLSSLGAASSSHTHNYLPLSNTAAVNVVNSQAGVVNFKSTSGTEVGIRLYLGEVNKGGLWANDNDGIYLYANTDTNDNKLGMDTSGNPYFYHQGDATKYGLLHRGLISTGSHKNDGLDAMVQYTINATALSTSNYYPIIFPQYPKELKVRMYSQTGSASAAYNCNNIEFSFTGKGWSDVPQSLTVERYNYYSSSEKTIGCIGMGQENGHKCIWVRGGLTYYVTSNVKPSLKTADYTSGNEIYTIGTNQYGGTNTKVTIHWTPDTTSGKGTMYHSGAIKSNSTLAGGSLNISGNATISGTTTYTGAATFNGGLNSTAVTTRGVTFNSANSASLSSSGWYRFATSNAANNYGGTYIFLIRRSYSNNNNESYIIACNTHQNVVTWKQLCGSYSTQLITNVRCTYTNDSTMYFDLQYTGTVANTVYVSCLGTCTIQTPTKTTSTLTTTSTFPLLQYAMGDAYAYIRGRVDNPLLYLKHTYNSTDYIYYAQAYQGYLMLGASSSKSLKIDSNGNCTSVAEITAHSDRRLKSNIKPLEVRGELKPVTYTKDGKESIGFIAQDVQELYPELVTVDESTDDKYLSLNYQQLTAVLYAEIKELKKEINELKKKI